MISSAVLRDQQVTVADVQVQPQLRQRLQQIGKLLDGVELPGQVLDHQPHADLSGHFEKFMNALQIAPG